MGCQHQGDARIGRQCGQGVEQFLSRLGTQDPGIGGLGGPAVQEPAGEPLEDLSPTAVVHDEIGGDPMQPGPWLFWGAATSDLLDKPDERLGDQVLGGLRVPLDGPGERGDLPVVRVVQREDRPTDRFVAIVGCRHPLQHGHRSHLQEFEVRLGHAGRTDTRACCCGRSIVA